MPLSALHRFSARALSRNKRGGNSPGAGTLRKPYAVYRKGPRIKMEVDTDEARNIEQAADLAPRLYDSGILYRIMGSGAMACTAGRALRPEFGQELRIDVKEKNAVRGFYVSMIVDAVEPLRPTRTRQIRDFVREYSGPTPAGVRGQASERCARILIAGRCARAEHVRFPESGLV